MAYFPTLDSISRRRKLLGKTQHAFAKLVGVSQSMIAKIENGKAEPSYKLAVEIFERLDELESKDTKKASDVMSSNVIVLKGSDTVGYASGIVRDKAISQFPVLADNGTIRSIRTNDMAGVEKDVKVGLLVKEAFPAVGPDTPLSIVIDLLRLNQAVVVMKEGKIAGIITAEDLIP
jgi:predicted transcriptional regulator